jgi:hypothetical protein
MASSQKFNFGRLSLHLLLVIGITGIAPDVAIADDWRWVRLEPDTVDNNLDWGVLQGLTNVKVAGDHIEFAMNYVDQNHMYIYDVVGDVKGTEIDATETHKYTDASPRLLRGTIEKFRSESAPWGWDRIILKGGYLCITLVRIVRKGEKVVDLPTK